MVLMVIDARVPSGCEPTAIAQEPLKFQLYLKWQIREARLVFVLPFSNQNLHPFQPVRRAERRTRLSDLSLQCSLLAFPAVSILCKFMVSRDRIGDPVPVAVAVYYVLFEGETHAIYKVEATQHPWLCKQGHQWSSRCYVASDL